MSAEPIAIALFNATWQSVALVAATALGLRLFGKAGARFRCALWSAVFFFCAALPFVDGVLAHRVVVRHELVLVKITHSGALAPVRRLHTAPPHLTILVKRKSVNADGSESAVVRGARALEQAGAIALGLYLLGVGVAFGRFAYEVIALIMLKRRCRPIGEPLASVRLPRGARLVTSEKVSVPCVLALGRPVIAVPPDMLSEVDEADLRRIVAHEAAHLERYDDWANLAERLVLVAFFFNPAMHYAIRQIATEREIACDDRVVMHDGGSLRYAECLTTLAQRTALRMHVPAPGLYAARKQIVVRVERLLDRAYDRSRRFGAGIAVTGIIVAVLAMGSVWYNVPLVADAQVVVPVPPAPPAVVHVATPIKVVRPAPVKAKPPPAVKTVPPAPAKVATPAHVAVAPAHTPKPPAKVRKTYIAVVAPAAPALPHARSSLIESLQSNGYTGLSVDQLVALADAGVKAEAVAGYAHAFGHPSVDQMIQLANHGVSPHAIEGWKAAGLPQLSVNDAIHLTDSGVPPRAVTAALRVLRAPVSVNDIIRAYNSGALDR